MKVKSSATKRKRTSSSIKHRSISVTKARKILGDVFGEVNYQKERIVLTSHKKSVAMVPIEDLELLEALEDARDIHEAKLALKEAFLLKK
ncbi:MAG: type II toxin-antitoxin system Phd/YefM family antitoxin [Candidatus Rhabdochlamydia sp.]